MPVRLVSNEEPLPGYRLLERLGRGGFGEVWKVEAPGGLHKAMKFVFGDLDSADDDGKPAEQELKALHRVKSIRHPYVLSLERFDIVDGQLIIVMELADRNLWDRFRECRAQGMVGIPRAELLRYLEESAEALDLMNNQYQIQHLDIKPQNIFLLYNHAKVADFGLAKDFEGARGIMTGGVTPVYAAPETFEGFLSRYTDQYSLAIVAQELLTGSRPFVGSNTKQLLLQHLNSPPDLKAVSEADRPVLERALSKTPADRWPSCSDFIRALRSTGGRPAPDVRPAETPTRGGSAHESSLPAADFPTSPTAGVDAPPSTTPTRLSAGDISGTDSVLAPVLPGLRTTPRPGLITPRLVTPQSVDGPRPAITLQRPQVFQTARMTSLGIAPPEKTGPGVLFPALVIGVGQTGLTALQAVRRLVRDRFGSLDAVPNVRFLYVDTDPDATAAAVQGPHGLPPTDVVLARLNRPAHYLQRPDLPPVEQWMPKGLLYQLPKNPGPAAGTRPFGRLALCDHYRLIAQRVRQEIEPFLADEPLDAAGEQTGLGVRSNRPRAYLLANLAGGTGSGMLVDLAYIVRHELRSVGYRKPDTVGVLFVPSPEAGGRSVGVANAFAAATELAHFGDGNRYVTRFDANEAPISDPDGPLARSVVVGLPRSGKARDLDRTVGGAAYGLFLELVTAAGPTTDEVRRAAAGVPGTSTELVGTYRLSWPRPQLLAASARRFAQRLVQRWTSRDAAHLREPIAAWLADQWTRRKLDWAAVRERLAEAVAEALKDDPSTVFDAAVDALRTSTPTGSRVDQGVACDVLERLVHLVGKPGPDPDIPGSLSGAIAARRTRVAAEADTNLAAVTVSFLEQPQYRLAGADEALAQVAKLLRKQVDDLDPVRDVLARDTAEGYARLIQLIAGLRSGGKSSHAAELMTLLFAYPTKKLDLLVCEAGLGLYRTLLNNIPEYRQEINFCRLRLEELGGRLAAPTDPDGPSVPGQALLPAECATLDEAADVFLGGISPEEILGFDQQLQSLVKKKFRGMVNVCLKPERSADFLGLVADESRLFLAARLGQSDPAEVFAEHYATADQAEAVMRTAVAGAATTPVPPPGSVETIILAVPPGPAGDRVRAAADAAFPGVAFVPADLPEEIAVYRTCPRVSLTQLPHAGESAREAYRAHADSPLHTRTDVPWGE